MVIRSSEVYWEVLETYSALMRQREESFRLDLPLRGQERKRFAELSNRLYSEGIPVDQFLSFHVGRGNTLDYIGSQEAVRDWYRDYFNKNLPRHIDQQEKYRSFYEMTLGIDSRVLLNLGHLPFRSWYRVLVLEDDAREEWIFSAKKYVRRTTLIDVLKQKGYDTTYLESLKEG